MAKSNSAGWIRGLVIFLAACAVVLLTACGGDSGASGSDEEQIDRLVRDFFDGTIGGDANKAYDMLDEASRAECSKEDFIEQAEFAEELFESIGSEFKVERVYDIAVNGDRATAKIDVTIDGEASDEPAEDTVFVREGGKWKVTDGC